MFCHQCGKELSAQEEAQQVCNDCYARIQQQSAPKPPAEDPLIADAPQPPKKKGRARAFCKRHKGWVSLAGVVAIAAVAAGVYFGTANLRAYNHARELFEQGAYAQAIEAFEPIESYRDAQDWIAQSYYQLGRQAYEDEAYGQAIAYLEQADGVEQAQELLNQCRYDYGHALFVQGEYAQAQMYFDQLGDALDDYGPAHFASFEQAKETIIAQAMDVTPTITLYVGDLPEVFDTPDGRRGVVNVAQSERGTVTGDADSRLLTIEPSYYPGIRIAKAHRTGDFSALNADEQAAYARASAVVEQAKAETDSDLQLEQWLHDYLCQNVSYSNEGSPEDTLSLARNWTVVGALLDGKANCQGFADSFYLLGTMAGFDVRYQFGRGGDELHVWNVIQIDGQWYNVDVTYDNGLDVLQGPRTYAYLNFAADDNTDHVARVYSEVAAITDSTPSALDYYQVNGSAYATLAEAADACIAKRQQGQTIVYVRVDSARYSSDQMSEALRTALTGRGIAASWMVYGNTLKGSVTFTVQWNSFQ